MSPRSGATWSKVFQPVAPPVMYERLRRRHICETFTAPDGWWSTGPIGAPNTGTAAADLTWTVTDGGPSPQTGGLYITNNQLEVRADTLLFSEEGEATTDAYRVTSPDCYAEFDLVSIGDDNYPTRAMAYSEIIVALRTGELWQYGGGGDNAITFVLGMYGSVSSSFPGPSWVYYVFDSAGPSVIDESGTEIEGTPVGHWRFEVEGDECRMVFNDALYDSGNAGPLGDYGRWVGIGGICSNEITPPSDTRGPRIDNLCAGNL